jgi:hypothetical protein
VKNSLFKGLNMPRIKIMSDTTDAAKPKMVPKSNQLKADTERFQIGNQNTLPLDKSFKREAGKDPK